MEAVTARRRGQSRPPLVSVIVPVYKVEPYLRRCADSILSQTFRDFELILVDDGSPDGCGAICDGYAAGDGRVRVIHKKNGGLSDARNAGIGAAAGEYLMFVDGDDYVSEFFIEKLYGAAVGQNADMAFCNFTRAGADGRPLPDDAGFRKFHLVENFVLDEEAFWHLFYSGQLCDAAVVWNKIYRRHLFRNVSFPVGKIHEDEFVLHRIIRNCGRIASVNDTLYFYVQRAGSIMSAAKISFDGVEALEERYQYFCSKGWSFFADKCMRTVYALLAKQRRAVRLQLAGYKAGVKRLRGHSRRRHSFIFTLDSFLFDCGFGIYDSAHSLKSVLGGSRGRGPDQGRGLSAGRARDSVPAEDGAAPGTDRG